MSILSLNQKDKRIEISSFEIDNQISFEFFNSLPAEQRDDTLLRALYIGVLALKEDRLSAFLSKTANELGTELESLKAIFDMKQELFFKTAVKGIAAEEDVAEYLEQYFKEKNLKDRVYLTGNTVGTLSKNKTGDVIVEVNNDDSKKIAIECKFDKSIKLGAIETKDIYGNKADTVWSQLLEASANRSGKVSIIVLDVALVDRTIQNLIEKVGFIPSIGFVSIIDTQNGDYSSLAIAYSLARNIVVNAKENIIDQEFLQVIVRRIIKDLAELESMSSMIESSIKGLEQLKTTLAKGKLSISFTLEYLEKFSRDGQLSKQDMFEFYMGGDIKEKYKALSSIIEK